MKPETHRRHLMIGLARGREKTCGKKVRHETEERAREAAASASIKYAPKLLHAYPCPFCNKWHVGGALGEFEQRIEASKALEYYRNGRKQG